VIPFAASGISKKERIRGKGEEEGENGIRM